MPSSVLRLPRFVCGPATFFFTAPTTVGVMASIPRHASEKATGRLAPRCIISPNIIPAATPNTDGAAADAVISPDYLYRPKSAKHAPAGAAAVARARSA